jgi:hypothetical protein
MIPYLPRESVDDSVKFFVPRHLRENAESALAVLKVLHEEHDQTEQLRNHPAVIAWTENAPFLAHYGLALFERYMEVCGSWNAAMLNFKRALERQLELASTADYTLDPPRFMGRARLHASHLSHFVTNYPTDYAEYIGEVEFGLRLLFL